MIQSGSNNRGVIQRLIQGRELEAYSTPSETSLMELFVEIVASISPLTIFAKHFILFVSQRYEYALIKLSQILMCCHLFHKKLALQSLQIDF